jgi:hypothetical protein
MGKLIFFVRPQIANPQIFGLIPQSQIRKFLRCSGPQILKFVMINPTIVNPQIFLGVPVRKSFLIQIALVCLLYFFYLRNSFSKLSQKPKVVLKFEREHFKLIFIGQKIIYLRISGPQKNNWVRKSQNPQIEKSLKRKKYMVRKSQSGKMPHLRKVCKAKKIVRKFAELRFAEHICGPPTFVFRFLYSDVGWG